MIRNMTIVLAALLIAAAPGAPAQSSGPAKAAPEAARQQRLPFVGCPSDGQAGYIKPPREGPRIVTVNEVPANAIAYYRGDAAPGAFAPRGWHCHVWYGSSGGMLLITPEVRNSAPGSAWPAKTAGQAVELSVDEGGGSGESEAAKYALLFFPQTAAKFIERVNTNLDVKISRRSLKPFANDSINTISSTMAEFVTFGNATGFGTEGYLLPGSDPISGISFLDLTSPDPEYPNFVSLRVRLSASHSNLKTALLRLNRECMHERQGCSSW